MKGYPFVVENSDSPQEKWGIPYDAPLFHWYSIRDRNRQLISYMAKAFRIPASQTEAAIRAGMRPWSSLRKP